MPSKRYIWGLPVPRMTDTYRLPKDKLTLIFWPYLRLVLLFLLGYGVLDWALLRWWPAFEPSEELRKLGLPLLLSAVLVLLVLWPRLRLLEGADSRRDFRIWLAMLAVGVMGCAANCLHGYLADRGSMTVLDSPGAVAAGQPQGHYYQFRHLSFNPRFRGGDVRFGSADKGRKLTFALYLSTPALGSPADTLHPVAVWLGRHYQDDISSSASATEKEAAYRAFIKRSEHQFQREDFSDPLGYYVRLPNTEARESYLKAARGTGLCPADTTKALLVLQAADEPFAARGQSSIHWLLGWLLGGSILFFGLLLPPSLLTQRVLDFRAGQAIGIGLPDGLRPRPGYWLTPLLLVANTGIWLVMALATRSGIESFARPDLLAWGADYGPAVAQGQWWRLLSSVFLHGSVLHLLNNMALLWVLGELLEEAVGTVRFGIIYLVAGLGSSLASVWWHTASVGVGASGAIFGLMGAAMVLAWRRALPEGVGGAVLLLSGLLGSINLVMGFIMPGVDNAAHLGGLLTGALLGLALSPTLRRRQTLIL